VGIEALDSQESQFARLEYGTALATAMHDAVRKARTSSKAAILHNHPSPSHNYQQAAFSST